MPLFMARLVGARRSAPRLGAAEPRFAIRHI
jgi:hypothetical protein